MAQKYDVNDHTRALLLEKLEKGQLWDSVTANSPISTEELDSNTSKITYADGSIQSTSSKKVVYQQIQ